MNIGTHLSAAKGFYRLGLDALSIGANTFQIFLRNPRGAGAKAFNAKDAEQLVGLMKENHFAPFVAHAPYTLNACSHDVHLRELSGEMFADDLKRLSFMPGNYYNLHPGSHTGQGVETAIVQIADMLNKYMTDSMETMVLLETMSGKGSEVGRSFEELRAIIDLVKPQKRLGICFDACHLYSAGYDIVGNFDGVLEKFDRLIGLEKLRAFHLNDSANPFDSRKDKHLPIGDGSIGKEAIFKIINHTALRDVVFITETPLELTGHALEIAELKQASKQREVKN